MREFVAEPYSIIKMIERKLASHGISLDEVRERAGIAQSTITRWVKGQRWPTQGTIRKLNNALNEILEEREQEGGLFNVS